MTWKYVEENKSAEQTLADIKDLELSLTEYDGVTQKIRATIDGTQFKVENYYFELINGDLGFSGSYEGPTKQIIDLQSSIQSLKKEREKLSLYCTISGIGLFIASCFIWFKYIFN